MPLQSLLLTWNGQKNLNWLDESGFPGEKDWYQIVVLPKVSSGGNKDGWETNMSITITIKGESDKIVTVKLIFKAEGSV